MLYIHISLQAEMKNFKTISMKDLTEYLLSV